MDPMTLCIYVMIPMMLMMVLYVFLTKNRTVYRLWEETAQALELTHEPPPNASGKTIGPITGTRKGFQIRLNHSKHRDNKNSTPYTTLEVTHPSHMDLGLNITPEGLLTGASKILGVQDIQTGDQRFDDAFVVQGKRIEEILALLTPTVRARLLDLKTPDGHIKLTDKGSYQEWDGFVVNTNKLKTAIEHHVLLMEALAQAQSTHIMSQQHAKALA